MKSDHQQYLTLGWREAVPVEIRRRKGTRHMRLSLGQRNQVVVSVPWRCSDRAALRFAEDQRHWLLERLAETPEPMSLRAWLERHPRLTASGDVFHVAIESTERVRPDYVFGNGGAEVRLRLPGGNAEGLDALVRRFAKDALACRTAYHAKRLGLRYAKLSVRDQSGRWGSCSSGGGISLNWRLVLVAPELQDYVLLHELAHLTEMNHSRRFRALLDQYDPRRLVHEEELDRVTPQLMRVGRG